MARETPEYVTLSLLAMAGNERPVFSLGLLGGGKNFQKFFPVIIVTDNRLTLIAAGHDMIESSLELKTQGAAHEGILEP